ncbi:MAG: ABC transporter permease [Sphingomonadales bacterium]|nr:ABC transporter permease [Sphingomonadales bacterium]MDE2170354.1 ABC transporter permease [Sphingomonadales bacterium]
MIGTRQPGRLSLLAAAMVIARRDFVAILWSRSFIFFLLGPLFPLVVGAMAGSIGSRVETSTDAPQLGIAMEGPALDAMLTAQAALGPRIDGALPDLAIVRRLKPGEKTDPAALLRATPERNLAAIVSGTLTHPILTGPRDRIAQWQGPVSLMAAHAQGLGPSHFPDVALSATITSHAATTHSRLRTAQGGQTLLFLLTMLLAGMVLSNLVEEKGNKIIEVLAAAIPMDAVFLGKLFAMLGVSMVGIAVWGATGLLFNLLGGLNLHGLPPPAVGWPLFVALGVCYFSMAYLLLGSLFLAVGSMASTVREVQTLSMPVTMAQLMVFFFASYALARQGTPVEWAAMAFPLSSPFAMLARAAMHAPLWPHLAALGWQTMWVFLFVRGGAHVFRRRVMQSGPQGVKRRRSLIDIWRQR